jgi:Ca2+:H+ antiporter
LNYLFVFVPATWAVAATQQDWYIVLPISFIAIIPLTKFLEYAGEQLALYCGVTLGDLIIVTCCNVVEVVLAIDLLRRCDLRLLQATIIGVTLLHLLLIPGSAFMTGGARVMELTLDKTRTNLNHTLLSIGVLTLLLPAAFFAALDRGALPAAPGSATSITINPVTDAIRVSMVSISRGLAIILLMVYVCSRIFLHNPPAPTALKKVEIDIEILMEEEELAEKEPEVNSWVCLVLLLVCVGITASCTVFLLNSLEILRGFNGIQEEWFGLVLLPFVSFSADAVLALVWYSHHVLKYWFGTPSPTESLASTKSIDASIQFVMFWMPFLVLLGWATGKPMSLLFDLFEVALLLGAAFLVNYVTAGAKTNWGEGASLVAFYSMIALTAFFYSGQPEIRDFLSCTSVASAISNGSTDSILSNAAKEEFANEVIKHFKLHVAA